ncbi:MAG TPA: hypothetical protein VKR53_08665 [Puia sp.]|nr:hypothetical protein [Puia sp.]
MKKGMIVIFLLTLIDFGLAQVDSSIRGIKVFIPDTVVKTHVLIDSVPHFKFILDSSATVISAFDENGKKLWQTDPWKDSKLQRYRVDRPKVVEFYIANDPYVKFHNVIMIVYNSSQTGYLDEKTGRFHFAGQD